jgi:hypothetical protein
MLASQVAVLSCCTGVILLVLLMLVVVALTAVLAMKP